MKAVWIAPSDFPYGTKGKVYDILGRKSIGTKESKLLYQIVNDINETCWFPELYFSIVPGSSGMDIFMKVYEENGSPRGWFETMPPPRYEKTWLIKKALEDGVTVNDLMDRLRFEANKAGMSYGFYFEECCAADNGWDLEDYWRARFDGSIDVSGMELESKRREPSLMKFDYSGVEFIE